MGLEIIQEPKNECYGQRRFSRIDPDAQLIDVSFNYQPAPRAEGAIFLLARRITKSSRSPRKRQPDVRKLAPLRAIL